MPGSLSVAAGGSADLLITLDNSAGTGPSDPVPNGIVVDAPEGVEVSGLVTGGSGLRAVGRAFALAAATCAAPGCELPTVPTAATITGTLTLTVQPQVDVESFTITVDGTPFRVNLVIGAGIAGFHLGTEGALPVGQDIETTLTADVVAGVTAPGVIEVPVRAGELMITDYPSTCTPAGEVLRCGPATGSETPNSYGNFRLAIGTTAGGAVGLDVVVPHGDPVAVTDAAGEPLARADREVGAPIHLTGAFGGQMVGAATKVCDKFQLAPKELGLPIGLLLPVNRAQCGGLTANPSQQQLDVPAGAVVVAAELTWAAGQPVNADGTADLTGIDTVTIQNGDGKNHLVPGRSLPFNANPALPPFRDRTEFQTTRVADVTDLVRGATTFDVTRLQASATEGRSRGPLSAWVLTIVWWSPGAAGETVAQTANTNTSLLIENGRPPAVALLDPQSPIVAAYQAIWAADPGALVLPIPQKRVVAGETVLARSPITAPLLAGGPLTGMRDQRNGGLDIVTNNGRVVNGPLQYISDGGDFSVAGPTLVISDPAATLPPATASFYGGS